MKSKVRIRAILAGACLLVVSASAWSGGLWISEYGAPAMGRAGAGAEAGVDDASASLYNPASMTRLQGKQFMATGGVIWTQTEFDIERSSILNGTNDGGDAGGLAPSTSVFFTQSINERWRYGVNFFGLTGSALDYDDNWVGRFQATDVELILLALQPTLAYKVNDKLSLGAGLLLAYTSLELTVAVPNPTTPLAGPEGKAVVDGDDTQVGYTLGAMISFSPQTRLGITYQSELTPSYSGDATLSPIDAQVGIDTEIPLAALLRVGVTHAFNDRWQGHVTVGWEDWDTLEALILTTETAGVVLDRDWEDTYHYAVGVTHKIDEQWSVQAGISYDTNPADKELRTADLPIDRQVRYAFGAKHVRPSGLEIAGHLVYADYGRAKIDSRGFAGEYKSNDILFFSVSFNWHL